MFSFNADRYDFWPLYETIKKYYPIGLSKENSRLFFNSYAGIKEYHKLIQDNLVNKKTYQSKWKSFDDKIEHKINIRPVVTNGLSPSYSSKVEIENVKFGDLTRVKRIHYFISFLGPYYTIIGDDLSIVPIVEETLFRTNYLIVSPFNEFEELFKTIAEEIECCFKAYQFVPFFILKGTLNGLELPHAEGHVNTIFSALFNSEFDLNHPVRGDEYFRDKVWTNADWDNSSGFVAYPGKI